jgi:glutathionyl-hydroquinone reductase
MRTPLSIHDLAVLTSVLQTPLEKSVLARRALRLVGGWTFDETVAVATVDRLVGLGALRKVGARYEITHEGRVATGPALQDHRQALEEMSRLGSPRLVEGSGRESRDTRASR